MPFEKFTGFTFSHAAQDDTPDLTPAEVKAAFDSRGDDLKTYLDALITALNSTTAGSSGADKLGMTAIEGLDGETVQAIVGDLKNYLDTGLNAVVLGQIPDGSLGDVKLSNDAGAIKAVVSSHLAETAAIKAVVSSHLAEKATDEDLGHVKVDGETIIATNGVITAQTQIIDTVTEDKWEWGMEDGVVFLEKVVS